jgi:hypothetical protein
MEVAADLNYLKKVVAGGLKEAFKNGVAAFNA